MSNDLRAASRPGSRALLARILDQPDLPAQVERLPPAVLGKLIDRVGLEDAGELVALASTEQLARMFDDDLWKNERPGQEEQFDAERFLLWLEVMLEAGEAFVAKKLVELPEDLVTLALHRHVLVIDIEALAVEMTDRGEEENWQLEKALESTLNEELGEYRLIARRHDGWDTLITAVLALDKDHHDWLWRVLERCCAMSAGYIEENGGLYDVLTSEEMLESDVAGDREDRRAESGHVAPAAASSFLKLARTEEKADYGARDPVTRAYFRNLAGPGAARPAGRDEEERGAARPALSAASGAAKGGQGDVRPGGGGGVLESLPRILAEEGVLEDGPAPRLLGGAGGAEEPLLLQAMRVLGEEDPRAFGERSEEIAYLANVVVAGCSFRGRRLRPIEAIRAVIATCSLGLSLALARPSSNADDAANALRGLSADGLFRRAYRRLTDAVVFPAARAAVHVLEAAARADEADRAVFARAATGVKSAIVAGTPWTALPRLDITRGLFDDGALEALRGLIDEQPSLAGLLAPAVSRPADEEPARFVTTPADLVLVARFLERLKPASKETTAKKTTASKPVAKKSLTKKKKGLDGTKRSR